jgi:hypothetical protein
MSFAERLHTTGDAISGARLNGSSAPMRHSSPLPNGWATTRWLVWPAADTDVWQALLTLHTVWATPVTGRSGLRSNGASPAQLPGRAVGSRRSRG